MILILFLYVLDVFAVEKEPLRQMPSVDSFEAKLQVGNPEHHDYGVSDFWWEDDTTKWTGWWQKLNRTIPPPFETPNLDHLHFTTTEEITTVSVGENETVTQDVTSQNETVTQDVTSQNEMATPTNTTISLEGTSLDTNITTGTDSATPAAPETQDANPPAQLRVQGVATAQNLASDKPLAPASLNYDYYGELHDDIPPNLRAPEYPGLSPDIPVILRTNKISNRPPTIPGWRLQFPERSSKKTMYHDGTPPTKKTTFHINYDDYLNVLNDGMKIEPLPDEDSIFPQPAAGLQPQDHKSTITDVVEPLEGSGISPQPGFQNKDLDSTVTSAANIIRAMDYPGVDEVPAVPDSVEHGVGAYSPASFNFEEMATGKEFLAQIYRAGFEGLITPGSLNVVKALSPLYTVPPLQTIGKITTQQPTTTTMFTAKPTTTISVTSTTEPTIIQVTTAEPTIVEFTSTIKPTIVEVTSTSERTILEVISTTEPTTVEVTSTTKPTIVEVTSTTIPTIVEVTSTTEPTTIQVISMTEPTIIEVTSTPQPSTTTDYYGDATFDYIASPTPNYQNQVQRYEIDWHMYSKLHPSLAAHRITHYSMTVPVTTPHPVVESLKKEIVTEQVGYFSVCLRKFFEIFSQKEDNALSALLKGASNALEKLNRNNALDGLGPPMWPGTELGFLQMRLAPIANVKKKATIYYNFYTSGVAFSIKSFHDRVDNVYYSKDGESMMQALAELQDFPGVNGDMNADLVMEHLFSSLLAPYFRDKTSPRIVKILKEINEKLTIASNVLFGNGRRNTQGKYKLISTNKPNFKNKIADIETNNNNKRSKDDIDYDTTELRVNNFGGKETNNVFEPKEGIDETQMIHNSYEDIKTEKIESVVVIGESSEKYKKTKKYHDDSYVRMPKVNIKGPGIVDNKDSVKKEKDSRKFNCYDGVCTATDTNVIPKGESKRSNRNDGSKVRLLKDTSDETHYLYEPRKDNGMGLNVKHIVTEATILYHLDKYSNEKAKLYTESYKNAKKAFKSTLGYGLLKHNKEKNIHTNRARNGEPSDTKWFIKIIKFNKSEPKKANDESYNKIGNINSKYKTNRETKHVSGQKLNCYNNNDECTATDTIEVPKRAFTKKYGQHKEGYENSESKVRPLKETKDRKRGLIRHQKKVGTSYRVKHKVSQVTESYRYNKYGNKDPEIYPKTYKKAKKTIQSSKKDGDKKWYLEIFKYNNVERKTYDEKNNKIGYINSKDKINGETKYVSSSHKEESILQMKGIKSKNISKTKSTNTNSVFNHKIIKETYGSETYDDETESKHSDKKGSNIRINGKSEVYDTFDADVDSNVVNYSKITNIHRTYEPKNKNAKRKEFEYSVKAKDYIKELRIKSTTRRKQYFRDIERYYTTTVRSHGEIFQRKNSDKKYYFRTKNQAQTSKNNATENEMPRYESNKVLEDSNVHSAEYFKNNNFEDNVNSFENELKKNYTETNLEQLYNQFNAKESKKTGKGNTKVSERFLRKRLMKKQNAEAKKNENRSHFSKSSKPQDVYIDVPDLKQNDVGPKNREKNNLENHKYKSLNQNSKKFWPHSKSQYIINDDATYLKERFLDFNRDRKQSQKMNILRTLDKNILRAESSYSDDEEVLKSNLQDNLLHGGKNFTDTLRKYKKSNVIRDISSYSDEEDTLKKNIYKLFT